MSINLESWHSGFKACLEECLPFEIGKMEKAGYEPLGLCICMLNAIETGHETECGMWNVKPQKEGCFLVSFRKGEILKQIMKQIMKSSPEKERENE